MTSGEEEWRKGGTRGSKRKWTSTRRSNENFHSAEKKLHYVSVERGGGLGRGWQNHNFWPPSQFTKAGENSYTSFSLCYISHLASSHERTKQQTLRLPTPCIVSAKLERLGIHGIKRFHFGALRESSCGRAVSIANFLRFLSRGSSLFSSQESSYTPPRA